MTSQTLEQPKTIASAALCVAKPDLRAMPPAANQRIPGGSAQQLEAARDIDVRANQGAGLLTRTVRLLKPGAFRLGLSGPGRLWYRDSTRLNAKERAVLDAQLQGIW